MIVASFLFLIFALPLISAQSSADIQASLEGLQSDPGLASLGEGTLIALMILFLIIGLAFYVYSALAWMAIAKKTNTPKSWMAWVPIANFLLMNNIAQTTMWSFWILILGAVLGMMLSFVNPSIALFIDGMIAFGIFYWWYKRICERFGKPKWWPAAMTAQYIPLFAGYFIKSISIYSILGISISGILGIVNLVLLGILAWGKGPVIAEKPAQPQPLQQIQKNLPSKLESPLINWINENKARGYSADSIKTSLKNQGYPEEDIDMALQAVQN